MILNIEGIFKVSFNLIALGCKEYDRIVLFFMFFSDSLKSIPINFFFLFHTKKYFLEVLFLIVTLLHILNQFLPLMIALA